MEFKFIHAADIHLGSFLSFKRDTTDNIEKICINSVYDSFEKICTYALQYNVDFVLISGDIYDFEYPSVKANNFFIEQCKRLDKQNINVYCIYGNHDVSNDRKEIFKLPSNVYIFNSDNVECIEIKKDDEILANVIGQSYKYKSMSQNRVVDYRLNDNKVFNIAMLHTSLQSTNNNYAPCSVQDLKNNDFIDYWALGHIHKFQIINTNKPFIAFPGIPQGRDMGEQGVGGCLLVEVSNKDIEKNVFLPTSKIIYKKIEISIDDEYGNSIENMTELEELILGKGQKIIDDKTTCSDSDIKGYVIQWVIKGRTQLNDIIKNFTDEDKIQFLNNINKKFDGKSPFLWTDSIVFDVLDNLPDLNELSSKNEIFKELDDIITDIMNEEKFKKQIIDNWGQIWNGKNNVDYIEYDKFNGEDDYENIIEEAEKLVIQKLLENMEH